MAIIDLVKWDSIPGVYVWKFPSEELSTWTQLIVSESQEAILLKGGKLVRAFGAGRHTLDTENIPVLSQFFKIPFGGKSPFTAEVWYINKAIALDVKWGTPDPIQLMDPKYQIMIPVRAFGQFGVQVENGTKFLIKLVGTLSQFDVNTLMSHFKGIVITKVKETIAQKLVTQNVSILEINAYLSQISNLLQQEIVGDLAEFGLKLLHFKVMSINVPEDDQAVKQLKAALAKKAEMNIVGYSYQQERSFDTLESAASNQGMGGAAGPMGAGMGLGMGFGIGGAMGTAAAGMAQQMQFAQPPQQVLCPKCSAPMPAQAKFCGSCGFSVPQAAPVVSEQIKVCDKCGATASKESKFCPKCGDAFLCCSKCGTDNPEGSAKCYKCSAPMPITCSSCETTADAGCRFCPGCGKELIRACPKCGELAASGVKFCAQCGSGLI